jgi:predicted amidophosphoribosyltransferase
MTTKIDWKKKARFLQERVRTCPNCGAANSSADTICAVCGAYLG